MFPGGSRKQKAVLERGKAYRVAALLHPAGAAFYRKYLRPLVQRAWVHCMREDAKVCAETLAVVRPEHRLEDAGFTKVAVAINNPTPVHTD
eukprot:2428226-Pleurochrysis_carterae.AAC.1